jgi:hypothetical protein
MVKHSFADIMYECDGFVTQNKQSHLPDMALTIIGACSIPFVAVDVGQAAAALANPAVAEEASKRASVGKIKGPSTATFLMTKTRNMMNSVLEEVAGTDKLTYALCISTAKSCKENATGLSAFASAEYVKDQCKYFALSNLVAFAQKGFPYIKPYLEFYQRFRLALAYDTPSMPYIAPVNERVIAANAEVLSKALVQSLLPLMMQVTTTGEQHFIPLSVYEMFSLTLSNSLPRNCGIRRCTADRRGRAFLREDLHLHPRQAHPGAGGVPHRVHARHGNRRTAHAGGIPHAQGAHRIQVHEERHHRSAEPPTQSDPAAGLHGSKVARQQA